MDKLINHFVFYSKALNFRSTSIIICIFIWTQVRQSDWRNVFSCRIIGTMEITWLQSLVRSDTSLIHSRKQRRGKRPIHEKHHKKNEETMKRYWSSYCKSSRTIEYTQYMYCSRDENKAKVANITRGWNKG